MKANKKKNRKIAIFFLAILFLWEAGLPVKAGNINLSQSILPVRLVYFDKSKNIKEIKDITSENTSLYIVKFYDYKNRLIIKDETETSEWKAYSQKYYQKVKQIKEKKETRLAVSFIEKKDYTEEVHTYL